eukprot:TRINITY_DN248_c0_g1_i1.p1 TRINITY_DN248_c0_g1~~TRINITY_DN248_c0_g1_i1.p1  ORF type:complete len:304 (+),score=50.20 TRINITY_DN248_c0_g1_i1:87-998(+)
MAEQQEREVVKIDQLVHEVASVDGHLAKVGHHDPERSAVSITARGVAAMRHAESTRTDRPPIINDPFAGLFAGLDGLQWPESVPKERRDIFIDMMAVRTRFIDETLIEYVGDGLKQIVIPGAGLDARAFRLKEFSEATIFELDFEEVIKYKDELLNSAASPTHGKGGSKAILCKKRVALGVNLGDPSWPEQLKQSGFDPTVPTIWLLEGLTGYLTQEELYTFLKYIRSLSASGSRMVATFLGTNKVESLSMHKFFTNNAPDLLKELGGWEATQRQPFEVAPRYDRHGLPKIEGSYWYVTAHLP